MLRPDSAVALIGLVSPRVDRLNPRGVPSAALSRRSAPPESGGALRGRAGLELFRALVGEDPGDLRGVAGVVGLLGAGRDAVAAEVAPLQAAVREDADHGAAPAAQGSGLFVFQGLVAGGGDGGERDLECVGVDRAQVRERVFDLGLARRRSAWADACLLATQQRSPRLLLDVPSVHRVSHVLRDLREEGLDRDLLQHSAHYGPARVSEPDQPLQPAAYRSGPDLGSGSAGHLTYRQPRGSLRQPRAPGRCPCYCWIGER
jgi:hypothetical protein